MLNPDCCVIKLGIDLISSEFSHKVLDGENFFATANHTILWPSGRCPFGD